MASCRWHAPGRRFRTCEIVENKVTWRQQYDFRRRGGTPGSSSTTNLSEGVDPRPPINDIKTTDVDAKTTNDEKTIDVDAETTDVDAKITNVDRKTTNVVETCIFTIYLL